MWIYLNYVEDQNNRIDEIKSIIETLNWRLRPEVASEIEKNKNKEEIIGPSDKHIKIIEKIFEGNL
jgi:uridine kinase